MPLMARYRRNIFIVISIVAVLMTVATGWICHVHTREWRSYAMEAALPRVVRLIAEDAEAMQELQAFLETTLSSSVVNLQMVLLLPQVLVPLAKGRGHLRGGAGAGRCLRRRAYRPPPPPVIWDRHFFFC